MALEELLKGAVIDAFIIAGGLGMYFAVTNATIYAAFTDKAVEKSPEKLKKDIELLSAPMLSGRSFFQKLLVYAAIGLGGSLAKRELQGIYDQKNSSPSVNG